MIDPDLKGKVVREAGIGGEALYRAGQQFWFQMGGLGFTTRRHGCTINPL